jgi:ATP-dependent Clp protease adaptor protein ClpS|tara:strand:+ start:516 stop:833 length:318 start_codon:yes stop_codon:yes gene_type:complete
MIESNEKEKIQSSDNSLLTIGEPKQYYVVMHNDDSTPFDFVIDILMALFGHDKDTSADLAHKIHQDEKAIVGMYNLEIAEQKVEETVKASRVANYPLSVSLEPTT